MATVLVVDDLATNRELLVALLEYSGHSAVEADSGERALALVHAERPDLIVCDILMPGMDGYEFVRRLRADPDPEIAATEVIFSSATFFEEESRRLAQACGVTRLLVKPCEPDLFLDAIAQALAQHLPQPHAAVAADDFEREHQRLLTDKLLAKTDELEQANQRLAALTDLNLQLASEQDPQRLLDKFGRGACELIGARAAVLCVRDVNEAVQVRCSSHGLATAEAEHLAGLAAGRQLDPQRFAGEPVQRPLRLAHPGDQAAMPGLPDHFPRFTSGLLVPVSSLQQRHGWVLLLDRQGRADFSSEDEYLLSVHAAQAGRIYENGMLYLSVQAHLAELQVEMSERRKAEERIERLHRVASVLSGVNSMIVRVHQRAELFGQACRLAVQVGRFAQAWVGLLDPDQQRLSLADAAGLDEAGLQALRLALETRGTALLGLVERSGQRQHQPLIVQDPALLAALALPEPAGVGGDAAQAWLPLTVAGRTVAWLVLHARGTVLRDDEEIKLLAELAGDMSFALEHIAQEEKINHLAYYDVLTGEANAMLFNERLAQFIGSAAAGGRRLALGLVDLIRFKSVNDTYGRHVGDQLLRQVAARLEAGIGERSHLARVGSDHFALIFPDTRSASELLRSAVTLHAACFGPLFHVEGEDIHLGARIGLALHPNDGDDAETLYRNAEAAVKKAKSGSETLLFYNPRMTESAASRLALEKRLHSALEHGELALHYQPKVHVHTHQLEGVEALLRWHSPDAGLVPPGAFIPLLEESGLILAVGAWVLRRASQDHQRWSRLGLAAPRVAVNVSAAQLQREDFVQTVATALRDNDGVDIEITESLVMHDVERSVEKLHQLRAMGIDLAIDDFGTGYSSLAYLARLPAQTLKIDRAFVDTMLTDPNHLTLVETMISLAHTLGMKVVAEGVETPEQADMLDQLRCDQMQGYLVGRPVPFDALAAQLQPARA